MRNWVKRLIWYAIIAPIAFAFQVALYLILGRDPVELVGDKVKMLDFEPTFLVYAAISSGGFALIVGLADLKYDWIGQIQRKIRRKKQVNLPEVTPGDEKKPIQAPGPTIPESPATPKIERDVWLLDAVFYVAEGRWQSPNMLDRDVSDMEDAEFISKLGPAHRKVMQGASDGDLQVWGKRTDQNRGPYVEIDSKYWENHELEHWNLMGGNFEEIQTSRIGVAPGPIYKELKTSKARVEELWPITKLLTHDQPAFMATRQELDKLFLAVVTVQTKVTNWESFDACKDTLIENVNFLREHEAIFEGSVYKQEYRDFMHAAGIAISTSKNYRDRDEMEYWKNIIINSSKILEEALR